MKSYRKQAYMWEVWPQQISVFSDLSGVFIFNVNHCRLRNAPKSQPTKKSHWQPTYLVFLGGKLVFWVFYFRKCLGVKLQVVGKMNLISSPRLVFPRHILQWNSSLWFWKNQCFFPFREPMKSCNSFLFIYLFPRFSLTQTRPSFSIFCTVKCKLEQAYCLQYNGAVMLWCAFLLSFSSSYCLSISQSHT